MGKIRFILLAVWCVSAVGAQTTPVASPAPSSEPDLEELVRAAQIHATMAQRARTQEEASQRLRLALSTYEQALARGAGSPVVLNPMAQLYLLTGNTERAIQLFHQSLAEDDRLLATYSGLNDAFFALGRLDSAIHYVEAARRLAPDNAGVRVQLGFLYLQGGARATARVQLDSALILDADHAQAHKLLGIWHSQEQHVDSALVAYERVIQLQPGDVEAHNNIAYLLAGQARYAEALEWYKKTKALTADPQLLHAINLNMDGIRAIMAGKMRARYILVDSQEKADEVAALLASGEDFGDLATRHSIAPNAAEGGDLGFFGPGDMVIPVEEAVLGLGVGETSAVIPMGRHFMLLQRLN